MSYQRHDQPTFVQRGGAEPATFEQVRSLRRWLVVLGIWVAAATAIALLAVLGQAEQRRAGGSPSEIRALDSRIDKLEDAQADAATSEEVQGLQQSVDELQQSGEDAADARAAAERASDQVSELSERVDALEEETGGGESGGEGGGFTP